MRFMLIMKGDPPAEASADWPAPGEDAIATMIEWSNDLKRAGILLADAGLYPSWTGHRISYTGGGRVPPKVLDGPFSESKEVIAGFSLIEVASEQEAIEWGKRCPVDAFLPDGFEAVGLEIRQVAEVPNEPSVSDVLEAVHAGLSTRAG